MAGRKRGCNRSERVSRRTDLDLTLVEVISHQRGENCRSELLLGQVCQVVAQLHIGAFYMLFELHWCIRLPKLNQHGECYSDESKTSCEPDCLQTPGIWIHSTLDAFRKMRWHLPAESTRSKLQWACYHMLWQLLLVVTLSSADSQRLKSHQ